MNSCCETSIELQIQDYLDELGTVLMNDLSDYTTSEKEALLKHLRAEFNKRKFDENFTKTF